MALGLLAATPGQGGFLGDPLDQRLVPDLGQFDPDPAVAFRLHGGRRQASQLECRLGGLARRDRLPEVRLVDVATNSGRDRSR
jgi:hypothetical protein